MLNAHAGLGCRGETDFLFDHLYKDKSGNLRLDPAALEPDRFYIAYRDVISSSVPGSLTTDASD